MASENVVAVDDIRTRGSVAFPETSWGLILATRDDAGSGRSAFADLCCRYWIPVYANLRRQGFTLLDADLVQGFFLHLIERGTVTDSVFTNLVFEQRVQMMVARLLGCRSDRPALTSWATTRPLRARTMRTTA
jgi:hypothetical protein